MQGENNVVLPEDLLDKIRFLIENNNSLRASRNLRTVLFDYLRFNEGLTANCFIEILDDVESAIELFELLAGKG